MSYDYDWEMGLDMALKSYREYRRDAVFGPDNLVDVELSPNGHGPVRLSEDYAFLKLAVIRRAVSNETIK